MRAVPSFDLPYHGKSQLTYTDFYSLAKSIALRIPQRSVVIGWSLGASLALLMSYMFPKRVERLLLIGASACFRCMWSERNLRGFLLRLEKERESFLEEFRSLAYPKSFKDRIDIEGAKRMLKDYMHLDLRPILPHIRQKVLILHGEKDPIVPFPSALTLYNMLKRSKLIIFPGGHFPEDESLIFEVLQSL